MAMHTYGDEIEFLVHMIAGDKPPLVKRLYIMLLLHTIYIIGDSFPWF